MKKAWFNSYPQEVSYQLKKTSGSLYEMFEDSSNLFSQNIAIVFFNRKILYADLKESVLRFAFFLKQLGIKKGDRVGIMLPNSPQFVISYYALLKLGAVVVLFNPMYTEREIQLQVDDSEIETFITLDLFYEKSINIDRLKKVIVASIADYLDFPINWFFKIKERKRLSALHSGNRKSYIFKDCLSSSIPITDHIEPTANSDIVQLQYSGGTTGIPKGVALTNSNLLTNVCQCEAWLAKAQKGKEIFLSVLPFFHAFGLTTSLNLPVFLGASMILCPKFDSKDVLKKITNYKPTIFTGVPAIFKAVSQSAKINKCNLSSIKFCISGAAALPPETAKDFEAITGATLVEGYGLTEASPVTHCNPLYGVRKSGSIGVPLPGTDCIIADEGTENEVPVGQAGELLVKGPQVMAGYWKNPSETKIAIRNQWLFTGDIARMDEDGFFYIVDRKKEIIISGGYNIYPREIEELLLTNPKIEEAAVIGIQDDKFGERPKAFIIPKVSQHLTSEEVIEFLKPILAGYKIPKEVEFRKKFPRSIIGKVLKKELRD
jgi:long-chain acyl-CoA synthetase